MSIDTTTSREKYYPKFQNFTATPGGESMASTVSHRRYNTITQKNEETIRPGIINKLDTTERFGTAPEFSDMESQGVKKYALERD